MKFFINSIFSSKTNWLRMVFSVVFCSFISSSIFLYAEDVDAGAPALVEEGRRTHVFLPRTIGRPLMLATEELQTYFQKMTGQELGISYREPSQKSDKGIHLVVRDEAEWTGKESAQAFVIEETTHPTESVAIVGVTITGNTEMAVLYGVYQYLEDLGVRWFTPGEIGENVPERKTIPITPRRQAFSPVFLERGLDLSDTEKRQFDARDKQQFKIYQHEYALWRLRNRLMFQRTINRDIDFDFNHVSQSGGHMILPVALGPTKDRKALFEKEPERFPVFTKEGVRGRQVAGGQICFTNEKNRQQAVESALAFFEEQKNTRCERNSDLDEVMDTFPMGLSDASGICECESCEKVGGKGPLSKDRLVWSFYNHVAKEVSKHAPGKKIGLFAPYLELSRPPEDVTIESNIVAVSCRPLAWSAAPEDASSYPFTKVHLENTERTKAAGAEIRTYNYSTWQGSPQMLSLLDAAEAYQTMGIQHFHVEVMTRHEQMWPILWVLAQYSWDGQTETSDLLAQYCREYYGNAGALVLKLIKKIDTNSRQLPQIIYGGFSDTQQIMTPELAEEGQQELKKAISQAEGKEKIRLQRFLDTWNVFIHTAEVYRSYCDALNAQSQESMQKFQDALHVCEHFWEKENLAAIYSPNVLERLKALGKDPVKITSEGRPELSDEDVWEKELFAFDSVPDNLQDLVQLPEKWKFRIDHRDIGLTEGWEKNAYEDKHWQEISTWNTFEKQGYYRLDGHFWYRVQFSLPTFPDGKRVFLRFGSIDDHGDIYVNGKLAYSRKHTHPDYWQSSFEFDVTDFIQPGEENTIAVRGYDTTGAGGIWRPVGIYTK